MNAPTTRLHVMSRPESDQAFAALVAAVEGGALPVSAPCDTPMAAMVRRIVNEELDRRDAAAKAATTVQYRPTVALCIQLAAHEFDVSVASITGPARHQRIVHPRHAAMWLARKVTGQSYPDIAKRFGGRDHSTVIAAVENAERLRLSDGAFEAATTRLFFLFKAWS